MHSLKLTVVIFCILSACNCIQTGNKSCPGDMPSADPRKIYGYRFDDDNCLSYIKVDLAGWAQTVNYADFIGKMCNSIKGHPFPISDYSTIPENVKKAVNYTVLTGFLVNSIAFSETAGGGDTVHYNFQFNITKFSKSGATNSKESFVLSAEKPWPKDVKLDKDATSALLKSYYKTRNYGVYEHELKLRKISPSDPLIAIHRIENGKVDVLDFAEASKLSNWYEVPQWINCKHPTSKDCLQKVVDACNYDKELKRWQDKLVVITQPQEKPYGKPCEKLDLSNISKTCSQNCRGDWSEWTKEPVPKCDNTVLYRYRPANKGDPPCKEASAVCCVETNAIRYNHSCSEFAYKTAFNLKTNGCKNDRPLRMSPVGHLECVCGQRYSGLQCEVDFCKDKCTSYTDCMRLSNNTAMCVCKLGFEGKLCDKKSKQCGGNGKCLNGGTCVQSSDSAGAHCKCPEGYGGNACERKSETCYPTTCSGYGICFPDTLRNSIICHCHANYKGTYCEITPMTVGKAAEGAVPVWIFAVTIVVVMFFFTLITFLLVRRRRRRRRLRGRRSVFDSSVSSSMASTAKKSVAGRQSKKTTSTSVSIQSGKGQGKSKPQRYKGKR